ncbi:hypothetical protein NPIL_396621 [Nephila pilipes]|uniref:Uncharacterized protein n=1 Tax=Nephila pilipes TaxID=299642 RepID=A0A8X6T8D5_NEPPI|nr:hypothetical protein NPIL_396621 [Nephila pilipes]
MVWFQPRSLKHRFPTQLQIALELKLSSEDHASAGLKDCKRCLINPFGRTPLPQLLSLGTPYLGAPHKAHSVRCRREILSKNIPSQIQHHSSNLDVRRTDLPASESICANEAVIFEAVPIERSLA